MRTDQTKTIDHAENDTDIFKADMQKYAIDYFLRYFFSENGNDRKHLKKYCIDHCSPEGKRMIRMLDDDVFFKNLYLSAKHEVYRRVLLNNVASHFNELQKWDSRFLSHEARQQKINVLWMAYRVLHDPLNPAELYKAMRENPQHSDGLFSDTRVMVGAVLQYLECEAITAKEVVAENVAVGQVVTKVTMLGS